LFEIQIKAENSTLVRNACSVYTKLEFVTFLELRLVFISSINVYGDISVKKNKETRLRIHNITAKATLKFGSEAWVLKKREEQLLEAAQMKFLGNLLGKTKLDKGKDQCIGKKTRAQKIVQEIKQYQKKWLQHVQRMDTNRLPNKHYNINQKDEGT